MSWLIPALLTDTALGLGGSFVGGADQPPPQSDATQIALAVRADQTAVTITTRAAHDLQDIAWLWPAPGLDPASLSTPLSEGIEHLEAFTRPRLEQITCDELIEVLRYRTPPGCASYEVELLQPPPRGEDAVSSVGLDAAVLQSEPEVSALSPDQLDDWLADRQLVLDPLVRQQLQPWLDADHLLVAVYHRGPLGAGRWLPPVRFTVAGSVVPLPLAPFAEVATAPHELTVLTATEDPGIDPALPGLPEGSVEAGCMLAGGTDPATWWQAALEDASAGGLPSYLRVHTGPADRCAPCSAELLSGGAAADLGVATATPEALRVGRLALRYQPGQLAPGGEPVALEVRFVPTGGDRDTTWIQRADGLGFAFPTCGGALDPDDVCDELQPPDAAGCASAPAGAGLLGLLALLGLVRRGRP